MKQSRGFSKVGVMVLIVVVVLIGVATFFVIDGNNKATDFSQYDYYSVIEGDAHNGNISDHVKTDKDGSYKGEPIYVFEYADFQCPGCASLNTKVNKAIDEADGKLAVVYRSYLLSYHQNATAAASAAEAAGLQDPDGSKGYWKDYADLLFANQSEWQYMNGSERSSAFEQYFMEVTDGEGDLEKFRKDVASNEVSKKISFDMGVGKRVGVEGTPAFYVEKQFIPWSKEEGGSIVIDGKQISWDTALSGDEFAHILGKIVEARFGDK